MKTHHKLSITSPLLLSILLLCFICLVAPLAAQNIHPIENHGVAGVSGGARVGQSFTAPSNGTVTSISFVTNTLGSWDLYLATDPGEGNLIPGAVYQTFNVNTSGVVTINLSTPFAITSGSLYRFEVKKTDGTFFFIHTYINTWAGSDYDGGHEIFDGVAFDGNNPITTPSGLNLRRTDLLNDLDFGISYIAALPVELIDFNANIVDDVVQLNWLTASEYNNKQFEVEASQDGQVFHKIGTVKGSGSSSKEQRYSFKDQQASRGTSYYRLKQIDFDGQFEYSKIISVNFKASAGHIGNIYPNPSKSGLVSLNYFAGHGEEVMITVFDINGKLIIKQKQEILNNKNHLNFDFSDLNTGIYTLKIEGHSTAVYQKLVIEK